PGDVHRVASVRDRTAPVRRPPPRGARPHRRARWRLVHDGRRDRRALPEALLRRPPRARPLVSRPHRGACLMPAERQPGMDHLHYVWSPLPDRPPLHWPGGAPVAVAVVVVVEAADVSPPADSRQVNLPGGVIGSGFPFPNLPFLAHREYGHRVGVFRVLDALARAGVPATVALDAMAAERYPSLVQASL